MRHKGCGGSIDIRQNKKLRRCWLACMRCGKIWT